MSGSNLAVHTQPYETGCIECVGNVKEVEAIAPTSSIEMHIMIYSAFHKTLKTLHYNIRAGTFLCLCPDTLCCCRYATVYLCTVNLTQVFGMGVEDDTWGWRGSLAKGKTLQQRSRRTAACCESSGKRTPVKNIWATRERMTSS